jgi:uridine kinase
VERTRKLEARSVAVRLAPADPADAREIALLFIDARKGMTYLPDSPYSDEQTVAFFRGLIEDPGNLVLTAELEDGRIGGFGVFAEGRMDHLYVDPEHQRRGIGTMLLKAAQGRFGHLEGWVFEKNINAIRLYQRNGFDVVEHTDGSRNEEGEPDVRIVWPADVEDADRALDVGALRDEISGRKARLVAIDGRGGSGKSTLARLLAHGWRHAVVVEMDDFYRPSARRVEVPTVHGGNYDCERLVAEVLEPVRAGRAGRYHRYDWNEDRLVEGRELPSDAIVLVEGVYSTSELLRGYFDYRIWVESPYEVRLKRGIDRDGEAMRSEWVEHWMPAEDRYIEGCRPDEQADLVLDGSGTGAAGVVFTVVDREGDR